MPVGRGSGLLMEKITRNRRRPAAVIDSRLGPGELDRSMRAKTAISLSLIIILGFSLRFYRLGDESLWLDEGASVRLSRLPATEIVGEAAALRGRPAGQSAQGRPAGFPRPTATGLLLLWLALPLLISSMIL